MFESAVGPSGSAQTLSGRSQLGAASRQPLQKKHCLVYLTAEGNPSTADSCLEQNQPKPSLMILDAFAGLRLEADMDSDNVSPN